MFQYYTAPKAGQRWRLTPKPGAAGAGFDFTLVEFALSINSWLIKDCTSAHSSAYIKWWTWNPENVTFVMILLCDKAHS